MDLLLSILNVASSEDETTPPTSPDQITSDLSVDMLKCSLCGSEFSDTGRLHVAMACEICGEPIRHSQVLPKADCQTGRSSVQWTVMAMRPSPVPSARTPDLKAAHRPKEDVPSRTATLMHDYKSSAPKPVLKTKPDQRKSTTNRRVHFADFLAYRQDADIECERKQREAEVSMQRDRTDKLILRAKRQSLRAMQCALENGSSEPSPLQSPLLARCLTVRNEDTTQLAES